MNFPHFILLLNLIPQHINRGPISVIPFTCSVIKPKLGRLHCCFPYRNIFCILLSPMLDLPPPNCFLNVQFSIFFFVFLLTTSCKLLSFLQTCSYISTNSLSREDYNIHKRLLYVIRLRYFKNFFLSIGEITIKGKKVLLTSFRPRQIIIPLDLRK